MLQGYCDKYDFCEIANIGYNLVKFYENRFMSILIIIIFSR